MSSILLNKPIPLQTVLQGNNYALKDAPRPRYAYSNGSRTDTLEGYVYTVVNMMSLDQVSILVRQATPVISAEDFASKTAKNEHVLVAFDNPVLRQYLRRGEGAASPEDSISADGIKIIPAK